LHEIFVACLIAGTAATLLFAVLGVAGAHAGHLGQGGHVHTGGHAAGHAQAGHAAPTHGHVAHGHAAHGQAAHGHTGGHAQADSSGGPASHGWLSAAAGWTLSWFGPLTLAAAAAWFGVVGLVAEGPLGRLALLAAVLAAVVGAWIVRGVMGIFVRASTPPLELSGEGAIATVNSAIRAGAPGEVVYTLEGLHRSLPARSVDGSTIPRGAAVVIERQEGGFAWVRSLDPVSGPEISDSLALPPNGSNGAPEEERPKAVDHRD
jgi:hypothetical protein